MSETRSASVQATAVQVVDPEVSRAKFEREVEAFMQRARDNQRRGWFLMEAEFPTVFVVFAAPQIQPAPVVMGVLLDFTNYDLEPPSVKIVEPFTREPYVAKDLPVVMWRRGEGRVAGQEALVQITQAALLQAHGPEEVPFLCIPGVREYHSHPAHTGDSWLLHRGQGEGTLHAILHTIYKYGVQPLSGFHVMAKVAGFSQSEIPT